MFFSYFHSGLFNIKKRSPENSFLKNVPSHISPYLNELVIKIFCQYPDIKLDSNDLLSYRDFFT
ncbi:hypothetical protein D3C71_1137150 [compost metagenome]